MRECYRLSSARLEVEVRAGYLHVIVEGSVRTRAEADEQSSVLEALMARHGTRRALLDLRDAEGALTAEPSEALWAWLSSGRGFEQLAYLLHDHGVPHRGELDATRVDMTALSFGLGVRCFTNVTDAHRWLTQRSRASTQSMPAVRPADAAPSSRHSQSLPAVRNEPPASSRSQSLPAVRSEPPASSRFQSLPAVRSEPPASSRSQSLPIVRERVETPRTGLPSRHALASDDEPAPLSTRGGGTRRGL